MLWAEGRARTLLAKQECGPGRDPHQPAAVQKTERAQPNQQEDSVLTTDCPDGNTYIIYIICIIPTLYYKYKPQED
jgi:hypothetical protein